MTTNFPCSLRNSMVVTKLLVVLTVCASPVHAVGPIEGKAAVTDTIVVLDKRRFDLARHDDLEAFVRTVKDLSALSKEERTDQKEEKKEQKEERKAEKGEEQKAETPLAKQGEPVEEKQDTKAAVNPEVTQKAKRKGQRDWSGKKVRRGLKAMERIAKGIQEGKIDSATGIHDIQEIDWAVESNFITPYTFVKSLDVVEGVFDVRNLTLNACGRGSSREPASNLLTYDAADLSKVDPKPSTFWSRPASIADKDLYAGFDRAAIPDFTDSICTYDQPHKGYGIHPSFEVDWHGTKWKVKFGQERSSGPFACRIFWALGYPAEIVDYTPEVKVRWDRRILTKFNSRELNATQIRVLGLPIETVHQNEYFDPFDFIRYAVLKDGSRIEPLQLRERLFPEAPGHNRPRHPEMKPVLYDTAFENRIDYLVMKEASFTSKESEDAQDLGFWDYNSLGHPMLREVRAMTVLNAWLDNWDIRWGNNRLDLVEASDGSYRLEHIVSDLGALFGNSSGMIRPVHGHLKFGLYQDAPNDYTWTFTHNQAPGKTCVPIRDYMPITKTRPFYLMNLDDARWMARLIAQLTEGQIKQALIGAGYDGSEARLLLEKLVARRDRMVKDLGLTAEIALLRPKGVDRRLTYHPGIDGLFETVRASGQTVAARNTGEYVVIDGTLRPIRQVRRVLSASAR